MENTSSTPTPDQPTIITPPTPPISPKAPSPRTNHFLRVLTINVLIILAYDIISLLIVRFQKIGMDGITIISQAYMTHAFIAFIVGLILVFIKKYRHTGVALILVSIIIPMIGFGVCFINLGLGFYNFSL